MGGLREWWTHLNGKDRQSLARLALLGLLGVLLLAAGGWLPHWGARASRPAPAPVRSWTLAGEEAALAGRLTAILSRIPGAGRVHVAVTLSRTVTEQYLGGGTGSGSGGGPLVVSTPNGGQSPVRQDELAPVVQGVVVVASGAGRPLVRQELAQAVETLLNLAPYQVLILPEGL